MAQLPPKIPNMMSIWPDFTHKRLSSMGVLAPNTTTTTQNPSWVHEFVDFSSTRRGNHRRTVSDPVAALKTQPDNTTNNNDNNKNDEQFDKFDDEYFLSMFTDEISPDEGPVLASSNTSTPSDHNSISERKEGNADDDQKMQGRSNDSDEVQSSDKQTTSDNEAATLASNNTEHEKIVDPKRVKRILANRLSAKRSRVRKLQYISELEQSVTTLQAEISVLSPRVAYLDHQRVLLTVDNSALKQRIAALAQDNIFKDAHQDALKRDIERLRQVYQQQNVMKMDNTAPLVPSSDAKGGAEKGQQLLTA